MKAYEIMVDVRPNERTTKTGQRLIDEHGGLGYSWMGSKVFVKSNAITTTTKRTYKNNMHGRGIEIWKCRQCDTELNDLTCKSIKRTVCNKCKDDNRRLRQMIKRMERLVCKF